MDIHALLEAELKQQNQIKRDKLRRLDIDGLVEYCKSEIDKERPFESDEFRYWAFRDFLKSDDHSGTIRIAQQHKRCYEALREVCANKLRQHETIPAPIAEYVLKVELGIEKPPSVKTGQNGWRDERIHRCVMDLEEFAGIQRSKSDEGRNNSPTAFDIVAEATGLTYGNVHTIYYRIYRVTNTDS